MVGDGDGMGVGVVPLALRTGVAVVAGVGAGVGLARRRRTGSAPCLCGDIVTLGTRRLPAGVPIAGFRRERHDRARFAGAGAGFVT